MSDPSWTILLEPSLHEVRVMNETLPQLAGVEHRFVEASDLRVHVAEAGAGDPVVLLHGWPQNWWEWRRLLPRLAERFRVVCPDTRGFGWSDAPKDGYDKETIADDMLELFDQMELGRVRLVGHDVGGFGERPIHRQSHHRRRAFRCDTGLGG